MILKSQLLTAIVSAGILMAVACGSDEATPSPGGEPAVTPDVLATITSQAKTVNLGTPTPTPVPAVARVVALEFAAAHRAISDDWDQFHADYDIWQEGLVACTASSVRSSLRGFAGRFAEITEAARALPRSGVVRELADIVIQATEQEEEALRRLRDLWQPGEIVITVAPAPVREELVDESEQLDSSNAPATAFVFEQFDISRAAASGRRQEVEDALSDREARTAPAAVASVGEFVAIFNTIDAGWDEFHRQYDLLRSEEGRLTSVETISRLGLLIDRFRDIVVTIRQLPTTPTTRPVAEDLAQAAESEDLALRRLRDTFQLVGEPAGGAPVEPADSSEPDEPSETAESSGADPEIVEDVSNSSGGNPETEDGVTFTVTDPTLFDAFDAQLVDTNGARLSARHTLEDILEDNSEENQVEVEDFTKRYNLLLRDRDSFHTEYNQWRRADGGCDRSKATETLARFTVVFSKIASAARDLPPATVLRPLGEILVEAAEREERALRELRNTWRPNDAEVYQNLDQERSTAGKLRRQVTTGIQELLERYGISPEE